MAANVNSSDVDQTKSIITGLITSNPARMTIKQLCVDFVEMVGYKIPLEQMGFSNVEQYLRSIPDTVQIYGQGPFAEVQGVIKAKSAHINMLVASQKKPKKLATQKWKTMHTKPNSQNFYKPYGNVSPQFNQVSYNYKSFNDTNKHNQSHSINVSDTGRSSKNNDSRGSTEPYSSSSSKTHDSGDIKALQNKFEHNNVIVAEDNQPRLESKASEASQSKSNVSFDNESKVPVKVQNNLKQVIVEFPDGLWCTKLPDEYKSRFKKELSYQQYGYRSLIEMCSDLPDILQFRAISDDFLLFDKSTTVVVIENTSKSLEDCKKKENVSTTNILDEIPKTDRILSKIFTPSDVLKITDQIPRYFPADLKVGDVMEISIGEIFDLSKFWVYVTFGDLPSLMRDLESFFIKKHDQYVIPANLQEEGLYCVSLFANVYHRCIIVNMLPDVQDSVRVFFVDYGTVENVYASQIWFLPKQFSRVPCQAIRARLSSICPVYQDRPWNYEAIAKFEQLTHNRVVVAEVTKTDEQNHVVEVYLADITKKDKIFYINDVLVKEGLATYSDQKRLKSTLDQNCVPRVQYIHLYPEFYEIESGMAPTSEERKYIIDNKVPLHHYMPQYFDITYKEDINDIQAQHEIFNEVFRKTELPLVQVKRDFDFSYFPDCLITEIEDLVQHETPQEGNESDKSFKEYSCNRRGISELINSTSETLSDNSSNDLNISKLGSELLSDHEFNNVPLLNNSTLTKASNPFHGNFFNETNPFRSTNPFLYDLDEDESRFQTNLNDGFYAKPLEDKLSEIIVNDLNISALKLSNIEKDMTTNLSESNLLKSPEKVAPKQIGPPPGFGARSVQPPAWSPLYFPTAPFQPYQLQTPTFNDAFCLPNLGQATRQFMQPNAFQFYPNSFYMDPLRLQQMQDVMLQFFNQQDK